MNLTKCDICKKKVEMDSVKAGVGYFTDKEFCLKCGKPIVDFLKKYKLIKIKK